MTFGKIGFPQKAIALLVALSLTVIICFLGQPVAYAGPDQEKRVATRGHIDEPKAFWENDNFVLRGEFDGIEPEPLIEDTVIWIGKGWKDNGRSAYTFVVPDASGWEFLGKPGQVLYRSPAIPSTYTYAPAWVGMGAAANIPTEEFRDGQFALDLVGFKGPGRMEMFNLVGNNPKTNKPNPPRRMFSSHDPRYRSFWMSKGNHTHNETTFTKPGRYELTYRVTARTKTGKLIASEPQTVVWQVGGANPSTGKHKNWKQAFEESSTQAGTNAGQPYFGMTPYDKEYYKYDADEYLTDLYFSTGNEEDSGRLVITVDGFFLTEVPVRNGSGGAYEMLGDLPGEYQAFYIPESGPTPRFRSAPMHYQRPTAKQNPGETPGDVWSRDTSEVTLPENSTDKPMPFETEEYVAKTSTVTLDTVPTGQKGVVKLKFTSSDPKMRARIIGGTFARNDETIATCLIESITDDQGKAELLHDTLGVCEGKKLSVRISPHPLISAESAELKLDAIDTTKAQHATVILREFKKPVESTPDGTPATDEGNNPHKTPEVSDNDECSVEKPCTFTNGHLDLFHLISDKDNENLVLNIKEDVTGNGVQRRPETVVLKVIPQAYTTKTGNVDELDNQPMYLLPDPQDSRLLWPGWDTFAIGKSGYTSSVIHFDEIKTPAEGKIYAFVNGGLDGGLKPVADSKSFTLKADETITIPSPTHAHLNWGFSRAGKYVIKAHMTATNTNGEIITSNPVTYTFVVEHSAADTNITTPEEALTPETDTPEEALTPETDTPEEGAAKNGSVKSTGEQRTLVPKIGSGVKNGNGATRNIYGTVSQRRVKQESGGEELSRTGVSSASLAVVTILILATGTALICINRSKSREMR